MQSIAQSTERLCGKRACDGQYHFIGRYHAREGESAVTAGRGDVDGDAFILELCGDGYVLRVVIGCGNAELRVTAIPAKILARDMADKSVFTHLFQFGTNEGGDDRDLCAETEQFIYAA